MTSQRYEPFQAYSVYERLPLDTSVEEQLKRVTTSTLAAVLDKKGHRDLFMPGVSRVAGTETMVGLALTLRLLPDRPDGAIGSEDNARNPQRVAIEGVRPGDVLIIDARNNASSGVLGDVLATRIAVLGGAGIVTDGAMRDVAQLGPVGLPVFCTGTHGAASPTLHSYADVNLPVSCAGARVNPGDVIVGDADGVVVIPRQLAEEVARDAADQEDTENWVLTQIQQGANSIDYYPPDAQRRAEYERWKSEQP